MGPQYPQLLGQRDTGQQRPWRGTGGEHENSGSVKVRAHIGSLQLMFEAGGHAVCSRVPGGLTTCRNRPGD